MDLSEINYTPVDTLRAEVPRSGDTIGGEIISSVWNGTVDFLESFNPNGNQFNDCKKILEKINSLYNDARIHNQEFTITYVKTSIRDKGDEGCSDYVVYLQFPFLYGHDTVIDPGSSRVYQMQDAEWPEVVGRVVEM